MRDEEERRYEEECGQQHWVNTILFTTLSMLLKFHLTLAKQFHSIYRFEKAKCDSIKWIILFDLKIIWIMKPGSN